MKTKLPIISFVAVIITMLIGILVIIGWFTHNDFLRMLVSGQVKMKFNVALGFVFSSMALLLHYFPEKNKIRDNVSVFLSVIVSLIGLLTLIEYIFSFNIGIDELFIKDELRTTTVYYAGRMSPLAAINFLLIGTGLLLLNKEKTATYQFYYLSGIAFIALLMLIGFNFITDIPTFIRLAIHVAIGFITLSIAIWFAQPMLQKKISFERKLFTGFVAVIILMVVLGIFSSYYSDKRISTAHLVEHANNVLSEAEQTLSLVKDIESGGRGYIITGDSNYLEYFTIAKNSISSHINRLKELTNGNPSQQARLDSLSALVDKRVDFSLQCIQLRNEKGVEAANKLMTTRLGKFYTDKIRNVISAIQKEENNLHAQDQRENDKSIVSFNRAFFVFLAGVLILLVIILFSIRNNIVIRKKAEEKLEEFKHFFNNSHDLCGIANTVGYFDIINANFCKVLGYSEKEFCETPFIELIHPDDVAVTLHEYEKLKSGELTINFINRYRKKDSSYLYLDWNATPNPLTGKLYCVARDITDRKKAEDALSKLNEELEQRVIERTEEVVKSERRFRALIENSNDIISLLDESFKVFYRSPSAFRITGWTDEEIMDSDGTKNIHPDDIDKAKNIVRELMANPGKPVNCLFRNLHKDGHYLWVEGVVINLLRDEYVKAIVFNFRDVTERIEAGEKLASSEIRFRSLIENSAEGIALSDEFSNNLYRSPGAEKITGILPKENAISLTHPEDLQTIKNKREEVIQNPGVPIAFQARFRHVLGHYFWMEGTFINLLHVEGVNAIVTNFRDITQRKEAEEKLIKSEKIYKTIASSIPGSVICLLDVDYRYLLIEGDMLEKLGYSKDKVLGNKAEDVLSPEIFAGVQKEFKRVFEGETVTRESNNHGYDIISRFIPLKDENNTVYAIMTVAIDITELKNAQRSIAELNRGLEEKIIQRTAQLESVNKELESFSYSVSHDLRAPLRIIDGFGQILMEDYSPKLDEEGQQTIKVIMSNARKMGELIDDLLNFSKIGRSEIRMSEVDMNELVEEVLQELKTSGISIPARLRRNKLRTANGDSNLLKQVWANLISNAIKYSGAKKDPMIEIGMTEGKGKHIYYVKDDGAGFDMQYADKLFGVFQRLHKEAEFTGTGVGLALVQRIIVRHGGTIWAEAKINEGATFYFTLPG